MNWEKRINVSWEEKTKSWAFHRSIFKAASASAIYITLRNGRLSCETAANFCILMRSIHNADPVYSGSTAAFNAAMAKERIGRIPSRESGMKGGTLLWIP